MSPTHALRNPPVNRVRRALALAPVAAAGLTLWSRKVSAAALPTPASLADELAAALRAGRPLIVMASLHGCPFCRTVRDSYLAPLRAEQSQPVVQVDMDSKQLMRDFTGAQTTHERMLRDWRVSVAPTVLFFGRQGREVAKRLAGASIPDFYGAYLEERLREARKRLG